ncbi:cytochrome b562 [Amphibiibacter pelophylacis]|uniref:Cytochrome b562 n=1 Tax=Amphibiibacter pelophylacis TaxID=1799477 RepID=A0ACC6NYJ5_9BURK
MFTTSSNGVRALLASATLGLALLAPAANAHAGPVKDTMKEFKTDFGAVMQSKTIGDFNTALAQLQAATAKGKEVQYGKNPAAWKQGMTELDASLVKVKAVADKGDLTAAKAAMKDVGAVRDKFHKMLGE